MEECDLLDGYTFPHVDGAPELANLCQGVAQVEYPLRPLQEVGQVTRCLFVKMPLEKTLRLKADYPRLPPSHLNFYSSKTVRLLIQTCGLEVLTQIIANPSRQAHEFRFGFSGTLKYLLKKSLLSLSCGMACRFLNYDSSFFCTKEA